MGKGMVGPGDSRLDCIQVSTDRVVGEGEFKKLLVLLGSVPLLFHSTLASGLVMFTILSRLSLGMSLDCRGQVAVLIGSSTVLVLEIHWPSGVLGSLKIVQCCKCLGTLSEAAGTYLDIQIILSCIAVPLRTLAQVVLDELMRKSLGWNDLIRKFVRSCLEPIHPFIGTSMTPSCELLGVGFIQLLGGLFPVVVPFFFCLSHRLKCALFRG